MRSRAPGPACGSSTTGSAAHSQTCGSLEEGGGAGGGESRQASSMRGRGAARQARSIRGRRGGAGRQAARKGGVGQQHQGREGGGGQASSIRARPPQRQHGPRVRWERASRGGGTQAGRQTGTGIWEAAQAGRPSTRLSSPHSAVSAAAPPAWGRSGRSLTRGRASAGTPRNVCG